MKRNWKLTVIITAGLCMGTNLRPAMAGHWEEVPNPYGTSYDHSDNNNDWLEEEQLRVDGSYTFTGNDSPHGSINLTGDWAEDGFIGDDTSGSTLVDGVEDGPINLTATGKIRTLYRWVPDYPNEAPPTVLNLKQSISVQISPYTGDPGVRDTSKEQLSMSLNNDSSDVNIDINNPSWNDYSGTIGSINKNSLVSIPTNDQNEIWSPWITIDMSGQADYLYNSWHRVEATISYQSAVDNRAAEIASSVAPSYYKDVNGVPQPHLRNEDGSMTVDTVAAWNGANWYWENGSLNAVLNGDWSQPQYVWGSDDSTGTQNASVVYPFFPLGGTSEASGPATKTVHVGLAVNDDDTRTVNSSYTMVFHAPTEEEQAYDTEEEAPDHFLKSGDRPYDITVNSNPPYANMGGGVPITVTNTPYWAVVNNDDTIGAVNVIGSLTLPDIPLATIASVAGLAVTKLAPEQWNQTVNYNDCWTSDYSTWDDSSVRPNPTPLSTYNMSPDIAIGHRLSYVNYDAYGANGYIGNKRTVVETVSSIEYFGHYISFLP